MTRARLGTLSLMLSIILWGTMLGGIAYSHLVYFPVYLSALPASAVVVNGPYGLNESTFWMSLHPPLLVSLIIALTLNWKVPSRRTFIGSSLALYAILLVATAVYFVPELIAFQQSPSSSLTQGEWSTRTARWERLSWLRGAVGYLAFVPLLFALTISADSPVEIKTS
jgi:hypothetical protein